MFKIGVKLQFHIQIQVNPFETWGIKKSQPQLSPTLFSSMPP